MSPRLTKFGFRPPQRALRQPESRETIFRPTHGFHSGEPPQDLRPGETPESRNFVVSDDYLTPRSGLSQFGGYSLNAECLGLFEAFDIQGRSHGYAASSGSTVAHLDPDTAVWSTMSYLKAPTVASDDLPSGISTDYWQGASVYDPVADENAFVFTNKRNLPKFSLARASETTYSDFTYVFSRLSHARAVETMNDRLVWFNVETNADGELPQRVVWSVRGDPFDYDSANGAGLEDLLDMRGAGQRLVADGDTLVLFSDEEIWRARPRFDAFGFDFFPVNKQLGCPYPQTIARTPIGIIFLARDMEVYLLRGSDLQPLGPRGANEPSRIREHLHRVVTRPERMWAIYNDVDHRYELHYPTDTDGLGHADRALYLRLANFSWLEQRFGFEIAAGVSLRDPGEGVTWDSIEQDWDDYESLWNEAGSAGTVRRVFTFGSSGTAWKFRSDQTNDDGVDIDARWRSHGLNSPVDFRYDQLYEVHVEYDAASASTLGVHVTNDLGNTFNSAFSRTLSASSFSNAFFPVNIVGRSPQFELRVSDGGQPRIARMQALLRDAGRWAGGS